MNGDEALNTSRAVLFEHRDEAVFNYYGAGSGLLFSWDSSGYVVTAKHVAGQGTPEQLRIPVDDSSLAFFRFEAVLSPKGAEEDWKDLSFYRVHRGLTRDEWVHLALPLDVGNLRSASKSYRPGMRVWVSGYPETHRFVDYDASHVSLIRCIMEGVYEGSDPSARGKHRIRMNAALDSFDGLSGSPVFLEASPNTMLLAGILIQGSASSGVGHFVGADPLLGMLLQIHRAAA